MQENIRMSETEEAKTFTACDKCNDECDPLNTWALPDEWAEALGHERGAVVLRGIFPGTTEQALAAGWTERDWGWMCPVCQRLEVEGEGEPTDPLTDEDALKMLTGENP